MTKPSLLFVIAALLPVLIIFAGAATIPSTVTPPKPDSTAQPTAQALIFTYRTSTSLTAATQILIKSPSPSPSKPCTTTRTTTTIITTTSTITIPTNAPCVTTKTSTTVVIATVTEGQILIQKPTTPSGTTTTPKPLSGTTTPSPKPITSSTLGGNILAVTPTPTPSPGPSSNVTSGLLRFTNPPADAVWNAATYQNFGWDVKLGTDTPPPSGDNVDVLIGYFDSSNNFVRIASACNNKYGVRACGYQVPSRTWDSTRTYVIKVIDTVNAKYFAYSTLKFKG